MIVRNGSPMEHRHEGRYSGLMRVYVYGGNAAKSPWSAASDPSFNAIEE